MAKNKPEVKEEEVKVEEEVKEVEVKEEEVKPVVKAKKIEYPEGNRTGRFHAVPFEGGYVVYNPAGQRATGIINKLQADDIVRANNQAAQIKG